MATYIILTRLSHDTMAEPSGLRAVSAKVSAKIKSECPGVTWKKSWVTMGRFDVVDVIESDDPLQVARAAMIIRSLGRATTETMPATPWKQFLAGL